MGCFEELNGLGDLAHLELLPKLSTWSLMGRNMGFKTHQMDLYPENISIDQLVSGFHLCFKNTTFI